MLWHPTYLYFFLEGMPEMLKPTSLIMGAGLGLDVACLTDGRFSGGYVACLLFVIAPISDPSFLYFIFFLISLFGN
jgi:hypothetical protein